MYITVPSLMLTEEEELADMTTINDDEKIIHLNHEHSLLVPPQELIVDSPPRQVSQPSTTTILPPTTHSSRQQQLRNCATTGRRYTLTSRLLLHLPGHSHYHHLYDYHNRGSTIHGRHSGPITCNMLDLPTLLKCSEDE